MTEVEKKWYQKWWGIVLIVFLILSIISQLFIAKSSNSSSSTTSACQCSQRWLATPKEFMKATDRWKYDECVRKFGGFTGANSACAK